MMKTSTLLILGLLITTLSGCASASPSTAGADVNGTWTGSTATGTKRVMLHLQQTGTNVTGTLAGAGATLDGPIQGTVEGNTVHLAPRTGSTLTPRLVVRGDLMSGELGGVPVNLVRNR
jgi:hypothetical protein